MNYHDYFTYDAATGNLIWKERPREHFKREADQKTFNTHWAGKKAGYDATCVGCVYVNLNGKMRKAHRIIYEMMVEPIPKGKLIDHKNKNGYDNRLANLRLATKSTNGMNRGPNKNSKTGLKGVFLDQRDGVHFAEITVEGKRIYLGRHYTKGCAAVAYAKAALRYHGEFARFV